MLDRVKEEKVFSQSPLFYFGAEKFSLLLDGSYLELLGVAYNGLLCLGGHMRKVLTLDLIHRRGWSLTNKHFLCQNEEESIDHICVYNAKAKVMEIVIYPFGVSWVLFSFRETLLG